MTRSGAVDAAIGFNWQGLTAFIVNHQLFAQILAYAYVSIPWQIIIILLICSTAAKPRENEFVQNYVLSMLICVIVGGMLPALAESNNLLSTFPAEFERVRSGSWRTLDYGAMEGLVAFPSFHTAFAIIAVYSVRHSPLAVLPIGMLNLLMLVSIPTFGGHYLTDMIGGAIVAVISILSFRHGVFIRSRALLSDGLRALRLSVQWRPDPPQSLGNPSRHRRCHSQSSGE